jgi:hypothetical protein
MGRAVSLPASVADGLEEAFGESVRHVQIFEHSLFARLHIRAVATTRPRRIYLRGSGADFFDNPWLMLHEYCHVIKQWESRDLTTPRYLLECLRHGYWNNRFEVHAREFADAHLARVVARLRAGAARTTAVHGAGTRGAAATGSATQASAEQPALAGERSKPSAEQGFPVVEPAGDAHEQRTEGKGDAHR